MRLQPPGLNPKMEVLMELNPINIPSATEFQKRPKIQFQVSKYLRKEKEKVLFVSLVIQYKKKSASTRKVQDVDFFCGFAFA